MHQSAFVDDHHGVGNGIEDRLDMRLAVQCRLRVFLYSHSRVAQPLAEPGNADAQQREGDRACDFSREENRLRVRKIRDLVGQQIMKEDR
jgi:hypothetical protein